MELAKTELDHTIDVATTYSLSDPGEIVAEVLRSFVADLNEDIATLEKFKATWGTDADSYGQTIANAKRIKRDFCKVASRIEDQDKRDRQAAEATNVANAIRLAELAKEAPPPITPPAAAPPATSTHSNSIKLPKITIPKFDGESTEDYRGFIEAFNEVLALDTNMTAIRKWLLLKDRLTGTALRLVKDLPLAPESFQAATTILEKTYGSKRRAIIKIHERLQQLPNAVMETASLRMTQAQLEGMLLSLTNLGVAVDNEDFLRSVILSKFPVELLHTLKLTDAMELSQFRVALDDYITNRGCVIQQLVTIATKNSSSSTNTNVAAQNNGGNGSSGHSGNGNTGHNGSNGSKSKGGAWGSKEKPQHSKGASTSNGGDTSKSAPPHQVTNSTFPSKREIQRTHNCVFCSGEHWSDQCDKVKTSAERVKLVADRCQKCLRTAHPGVACHSNWQGCCYCKELTHNRAICPKQFATASKILLAKPQAAEKSVIPVSVLTKFITAMLQIGKTKQKKKVVRTLLDTAGGRSLITTKLANELELISASNERIKLTTADNVKISDGAKQVRLLLLPPKKAPIVIDACVVDKIVDDIISTDVAKFKQLYPEHQNRLMPPDGNGEEIQLLLGYKALTRIITLQKSIKVGETQLMSTLFGWIPFGDLPDSNDSEGSNISLIKELDPIKLMCDLDAVGMADITKSASEEELVTLEKFHKTIQKVGNNYQVEWPFRYDPPDLQDNFGLAIGRLNSLYKQLSTTPEMLKAYDEIVRNQMEDDIIETVNVRTRPPRGRIHYLPHRGIIRFGKSTPIRMVFDAAAKTGKLSRSLNDNIYKGGNWVNDLPGVLLRFRKYGTAITSDISKAFHQILIAPKDRDVVRFLWLRDVSKPPTPDNIITYRFKRMAFGIVASPFLLTATIRHHLRHNPNEFAQIIEDNLYADNLVVSLPKSIDTTKFYTTIKSCFADMGMNMAQWITDDDELQKTFSEDDRMAETLQSSLGIDWNTVSKTLCIKAPKFQDENKSVTKRVALKESAKVYDPLGWVLPIVMKARIFLRKIWQENYDWDTPLTPNPAEEWQQIREQLKRVSEISIPRAYAHEGIEDAKRLELHAFCDASANAYGVAIYLLVRHDDRTWTGLVSAKARLAPKSQLSIPRLELLAAIIASKYILYVEKSLKLDNKIDKYIWGDSKCVIAWMSTNKVLPAFIEKSAKEFQSSGIHSMLYVPTAENPADPVSRGANIEVLLQQKWWTGPSWLAESESWPTQPLTCETENELATQTTKLHLEEEKILLVRSAVNLKKETDPLSADGAPFGLDPNKYQTLGMLLRATAVRLKAAMKFLRGRGSIDPTINVNYQYSLILWLRWDQQRMYEPIEENKKSNVSYLRNLKIQIDENGLIRCITRVKWAKVSKDEAEPILLAKRTSLTRLIILSAHQMKKHAGTSQTLTELRQRYWVPHGRRECYNIVRNQCFKCRRHQTEPYKAPDMAPLPEFRVNRTEKPFTNVGVDMLGPIKVWVETPDGPKKVKRWVVLFTCLVIRAVHLEILQDMTTEEFLSSFRKFVGRRGAPKLIVSDNALQFEKASGIFKNMWKEFADDLDCNKYYAKHQINWRFLPPYSPWMGGAYERMVQTAKRTFLRVYGGKVMTDTELQVAIVEVEAVINSRPITYVDREKDTELITPNDFLCVRYPAIPIDFSKEPTNEYVANCWQAADQYIEEFWQVWSDHYLQEIRDRRDAMKSKRKDHVPAIKTGELVLMVDLKKKRSSWTKAVVERLIKGDDGIARAAQVRTNNRNRYIRPITKLAPLRLMMEMPEDVPILTDDRPRQELHNIHGDLEVTDSEDDDPQESLPITSAVAATESVDAERINLAKPAETRNIVNDLPEVEADELVTETRNDADPIQAEELCTPPNAPRTDPFELPPAAKRKAKRKSRRERVGGVVHDVQGTVVLDRK